MFHTLYMISVLTTNPTIPADLKALEDDQFKVREAATKRLRSLPSWTATYFKYYARKSTNPEMRIRCKRVYETLYSRWMLEREKVAVEYDLERRKAVIRNE